MLVEGYSLSSKERFIVEDINKKKLIVYNQPNYERFRRYSFDFDFLEGRQYIKVYSKEEIFIDYDYIFETRILLPNECKWLRTKRIRTRPFNTYSIEIIESTHEILELEMAIKDENISI